MTIAPFSDHSQSRIALDRLSAFIAEPYKAALRSAMIEVSTVAVLGDAMEALYGSVMKDQTLDGATTVCSGNFQINNTSTSPLPVILMGVDAPSGSVSSPTSHTYTFQVQAGSYAVTGLNINLLCAELRR